MKKYNIIYADPPWTFKTYSKKGKEKKSAECHYKCMTIEDIYNLPIDKIADDNCVLFLWVTAPLLKEGIKTLESWGFTYKTLGFNWFKGNKKSDSWFWGLGYWTRSNSEFVLLGTKGKPKRVSKSVHQIVNTEDEEICDDWDNFSTIECIERIMQHSKKPDSIRDKIVELCGDLPRVELFAREKFDGWDCIGNEIDGKDIREFLEDWKDDE